MNAIVQTPFASSVQSPLKASPALGAALAFLGVKGAVPVFWSNRGMSGLAVAQLPERLRETLPMLVPLVEDTVAMLGSPAEIVPSLVNLKRRLTPSLIGICSSATTELQGEDLSEELDHGLARRGREFARTKIVHAATCEFGGGLEGGWSKAVQALVGAVVPLGRNAGKLRQVNVLAGQHLAPGDVKAIKGMIAAFGLKAVVVPDLSGTIDDIVCDQSNLTTYSGTTVDEIATMGQSLATLAIGEHMREAGELLEQRTGVPLTTFASLIGLASADCFVVELAQIAGCPIPLALQRQRARLIDTILDAEDRFCRQRVAIAAEPDLLFSICTLFQELGADIDAAVSTAGGSRILSEIPSDIVLVGDQQDLAARAARADLIATPGYGRQAAARLGVPHLSIGVPATGPLGSIYRTTIGYSGTRRLVYEIGKKLSLTRLGNLRADADAYVPSQAGFPRWFS